MKNIYFSSLKIRDNFSLFDIFLRVLCKVYIQYKCLWSALDDRPERGDQSSGWCGWWSENTVSISSITYTPFNFRPLSWLCSIFSQINELNLWINIYFFCQLNLANFKSWMTVLKEEIRAQGGVVDGVRTRFQFPASHIHLLTFDHWVDYVVFLVK